MNLSLEESKPAVSIDGNQAICNNNNNDDDDDNGDDDNNNNNNNNNNNDDDNDDDDKYDYDNPLFYPRQYL